MIACVRGEEIRANLPATTRFQVAGQIDLLGTPAQIAAFDELFDRTRKVESPQEQPQEAERARQSI